MSLIETAKANNLNIYQYLYTLLLYMPDYKNEPAGICERWGLTVRPAKGV